MKYLAACALSAVVAFAMTATASATPTPILLGNAGVYALLAGSGMTNTGVSTVTGDAGSSTLSTQTGFGGCPAANCVALTGANHTDPSPNDTATQNAKTDLTTAYNAAAGQTPTQIPTELAGTTLTAGVYKAASGTFGMTGTLVLDGANNADSIFIFQTGTTLITAGSGKVSFIRGAQACNVFWQVGSAATLGAGSDFSGTIMAHDNISLGDGVTVNGRLLAGEQALNPPGGAVTLIHDTIIRPTTCTTQASIDAATAAAALAQAKAAAAAQAAIDAAVQADRAAAAAREADVKAAADAAAKAAAAAAAATQAAAVAAAAVQQAAADAAKAAAAKAAATQAATSARIAKAAATAARTAKAKAIRLARAHAIALKRNAVRAPHARAGFTG